METELEKTIILESYDEDTIRRAVENGYRLNCVKLSIDDFEKTIQYGFSIFGKEIECYKDALLTINRNGQEKYHPILDIGQSYETLYNQIYIGVSRGDGMSFSQNRGVVKNTTDNATKVKKEKPEWTKLKKRNFR